MGSGSGADATPEERGISILPAPAAAPQENGLLYAARPQTINDSTGVEVVAITAEAGDDGGAVSDTVRITLGSDFFDLPDTEKDAVISFLSEDVVITGGEGHLTNGQIVRLFADPSGIGASAAALQVLTSEAFGPVSSDPINAEAHSIVGFLADPDAINRRLAGSVIYAGELIANGYLQVDGISTDALGVEVDGAVTITANFQDSWVSGRVDAQYDHEGTSVPVDLTMAATAFSGNTFAGDFECTVSNACSSDTALDAAFYGVDGAEIGGVLDIEVIQDVDGATHVLDGVGGFVIAPDGVQ